MRACLYARYSTDLQRETSIDDQLRAARDRAEREGWTIVATHADEGVSGSMPVALRRGGKALMADLVAHRFDVLIVEGLDRLSRQVGESEQLVSRLEHRGVRIIGTSDGYDTQAKGRKVMRIARGLVNELYLDDLREKTHRGLAGQFDRGMSAGGRSYGYRTVEVAGGRRLAIDSTEAENVRWVFERYADGYSVQSIVHDLNARGVPSARGGTWAVSAVYGSAARGLGMLNNELYAGRVVWNRRQWIKDPDTGKRRYVDRPANEWQARDEPELRIVDHATWERVRSRLGTQEQRGRNVANAQRGKGAKARTLFGGLLKCPTCGGPWIAINTERYGCGVRKDRGTTVCGNTSTVQRNKIETRLLSVVREELLDPAALAELQSTFQELLAAATAEENRAGAGARARIAELERELANLLDTLAAVGQSPAIVKRLQATEAEVARLRAQTAPGARERAKLVVDDVMGRYKRLLMDLQGMLTDASHLGRTRSILADMLGQVTVVKGDDGAMYAEFDEPADRLAIAVGESLGLVAGARNGSRRRIRIG
jgi:site-specific DNA recombinase